MTWGTWILAFLIVIAVAIVLFGIERWLDRIARNPDPEPIEHEPPDAWDRWRKP